VNLGPRMRAWREANNQRIIMTSDGPLIAYHGEFVMVVVGKSLEECRSILCPMLRDESEPSK
jgi:hypothetical protein